MSPRNSSKKKSSGVLVDKPGMNVYTVMLIIALVALSLGCLLLFLELNSYGSFPWWKVR